MQSSLLDTPFELFYGYVFPYMKEEYISDLEYCHPILKQHVDEYRRLQKLKYGVTRCEVQQKVKEAIPDEFFKYMTETPNASLLAFNTQRLPYHVVFDHWTNRISPRSSVFKGEKCSILVEDVLKDARVFFIIGTRASGKTTLVRSLMDVLKPTYDVAMVMDSDPLFANEYPNMKTVNSNILTYGTASYLPSDKRLLLIIDDVYKTALDVRSSMEFVKLIKNVLHGNTDNKVIITFQHDVKSLDSIRLGGHFPMMTFVCNNRPAFRYATLRHNIKLTECKEQKN